MMKQLEKNKTYDVILGMGHPRKGIYLGIINSSIHKILMRSDEKDMDMTGTPRIYNFNEYELEGSRLRIPSPDLARRLTLNESWLTNEMLEARGI